MLNTKTKILLIICFLLIVVSLSPNVLAASSTYIFETTIPWFNTKNITGFGDLVNQIIKLSYRLAILFVLYKIIEIGFKYMTGTGKAESVVSVAKGSKNLLVGVLILFGSYIILYTINPSLTQLPNNINCPSGSAFCDQQTKSKTTEVKITCIEEEPMHDLSDREYLNLLAGSKMSDGSGGGGGMSGDGGFGSGGSSGGFGSGNTIDDEELRMFIENNSSSIYDSPDSRSALNDLSKGMSSPNIWLAIKKAIENKNKWLDYNSCYNEIEIGPIFTNHKKTGNYTSCHDTYKAVDFVVRDINKKDDTKEAQYCMYRLMNYLRDNMSDKVKVCDETMFEPPHIHVQDVNCNVPCRTK